MKKEAKSKIIGKLIGQVLTLVAGYYCVSRVTHALLPRETPNDVFIILNFIATTCVISLSSMHGELIKIRSKLKGE